MHVERQSCRARCPTLRRSSALLDSACADPHPAKTARRCPLGLVRMRRPFAFDEMVEGLAERLVRVACTEELLAQGLVGEDITPSRSLAQIMSGTLSHIMRSIAASCRDSSWLSRSSCSTCSRSVTRHAGARSPLFPHRRARHARPSKKTTACQTSAMIPVNRRKASADTKYR